MLPVLKTILTRLEKIEKRLGDEESIKNITIKIDKTMPEIIMEKVPQHITNSANITFEWRGNDMSEIYYSYCLINYSSWSNWNHTTNISFHVGEGNYTFVVKAKDMAGNIASLSYKFTVNFSIISTEIHINPMYMVWASLNSTINLTANIGNITYYRIWHYGWHPAPGGGDGIGDNFYIYSGNFSLSSFEWTGEGKYYIEFYSVADGNTEVVKNVTFMVDASPPYISIKTDDTLASHESVKINITSYDNESGLKIIEMYYWI